MASFLIFHIVAGFAALLAGGTALVARKGSTLHRRGGQVFVAAMLSMTLSGALIAAQDPANRESVLAGLLTAYLVLTAWLTVHPQLGSSRLLTAVLMLVAAGLGAWTLTIALAQASTAALVGYLVPLTIAWLGAALDLRRLLKRVPDQGKHRLARHLWRMTLAMLIATLSFFLGQADELPSAWRIWPLLALPPLAVLVALFWHLARTLWPRRRSVRALTTMHAAALTGSQPSLRLP